MVDRSAQLEDYALLLRRQWWVVLLTILVCTGLAGAYSLLAPAEYSSSTSVLVTSTGVTGETESSSSRGPSINMDTEAQIITSTEVVTAAARALDATGDPAELVERLSVTVPPNTEILDLDFRAATAEDARRGARAFADAYLENRRGTAQAAIDEERATLETSIQELTARLQQLAEANATLPQGSPARAFNASQSSSLNDQLGRLGAQVNELDAINVSPGRVITEASLPESPSSPDLLMNLAAGGLLGLLAGLGLAVLRQRSDRVLRRPEDVERRTGLPVVGALHGRRPSDVLDVVSPTATERRTYSRLRNLAVGGAGTRPRVVLVAGVSGPAGAVAGHLAATLARAGQEVALVCADVENGTEDHLLDGPAGNGLSEVLAGRVEVRGALRRRAGLPGLAVLGAGQQPDQAVELLQTARARQVFDDLVAGEGWVVVEAPPVTSGAEAQTLAGYADVAVLVVQVGRTTAQDVLEARAQVESMGAAVLGAVALLEAGRQRAADGRPSRERAGAGERPRRVAPAAPPARNGGRPGTGDRRAEHVPAGARSDG